MNDIVAALPNWLFIFGIGLAALALSLLIKIILFKQIVKAVDKTRYHYDSLLVQASNAPLTIIVLVINLMIFNHLLFYFEIAKTPWSDALNIAAKVLIILAVVLFVDRFLSGTVQHYTLSKSALQTSNGIIKGVVRGLVFGIGLMILLGTLGISITPIIASLGISSLAVALALQPTLENFFSGVQLVIDKPIRVGDFIELESGEQGFVERIGWRSTWIKMLPNNTVIMPNSVLSQSKIINYFYPTKELSVPVEVGVHYSSDLEKVERITLEVAKDILRSHEWGVSDYDTFVVFHTFSDSSINFTVMLRAQEYFHRFFIRSAFIKALHKRYAEEGIVIPYPIRAINTDQENVHIRMSKSDL